MVNGLIFPYPARTARAEPRDTKPAQAPKPFGVRGLSRRPERGEASDGVTQEGSPSRAVVVPGQGRRVAGRQIRLPWSLRSDGEPVGVKRGVPMLSRKASSEGRAGPYPKPTQVVW
jgi:hypothetical protein